MKAHTKGGLGFMAEDANSLHDRWQHKKVEDIGRTTKRMVRTESWMEYISKLNIMIRQLKP